jgi:hypothetical protein
MNFLSHVGVRSRQMVETAASKWARWAIVAAGGSRHGTLACDATQSLGVERVQWLRASEAGLVADPQATILLPRKVWQEVVFRIDVVAERACAEEGVDEATIWELTKNLTFTFSTDEKWDQAASRRLGREMRRRGGS